MMLIKLFVLVIQLNLMNNLVFLIKNKFIHQHKLIHIYKLLCNIKKDKEK